jgi:hypothetical protein
VDFWSNKRVTLNDSWGPGAAHTLTTPLGQQPEFSLRPLHLRDAQGNPQLAHFTIDFPSGFLADGWQGVNFTPLGSSAVAGITGLAPWDSSQSAAYRKAIDAASVSLGDSRTVRLEAVIPHLGPQGGVGYNKVRLFYVFNAVQGPIPDLVVIKIATHVAIPGTVQARQDGTGHGPPH